MAYGTLMMKKRWLFVLAAFVERKLPLPSKPPLVSTVQLSYAKFEKRGGNLNLAHNLKKSEPISSGGQPALIVKSVIILPFERL
jgi:hypothetical protein